MMNAESEHLTGESQETFEWLSGIWFGPETDLENDVVVVVGPAGEIVASAFVESGAPYVGVWSVGAVALGHHGLGIGTALVAEAERRAQRFVSMAPPGSRVVISQGSIADEPHISAVLLAAGYVESKRTHVADRVFAGRPIVPVDPPGIQIRPIQPGEESILYDAISEGFSDDWDEGNWPSEETWRHRYLGEGVDRSLLYAAWDGATMVGGLVANLSGEARASQGWVSLLSVRPAYRGRGIGEALLLRAFAEFFDRGRTGAGLMVAVRADSTAATRLYARAGMTLTPRFATWVKDLRPGG
jgi:mycothiol synthase